MPALLRAELKAVLTLLTGWVGYVKTNPWVKVGNLSSSWSISLTLKFHIQYGPFSARQVAFALRGACEAEVRSSRITTADIQLGRPINMSQTGIILIVLSATLHAAWNFLGKKSKTTIVFFWWSLAFMLVAAAPLVLYVLHNTPVDHYGWYVALASGIVVFLNWLFLAMSYKYGDLSLVYPIVRSAPIFVPILAVIIFRERLSPLGVTGILAVVVGVYIIPMKSLGFRNFIRPFSHLKSKAVVFAILTALSISGHQLIDKVGTRFFNPMVYVWLINFVAFVFLTPYVAFFEGKKRIRDEWILNKWVAAATGIVILISYSLVIFVMRFEKISYIVAVRQISIVIAVILGIVLLREEHGLVRLLGSSLIFFGVICISMAG